MTFTRRLCCKSLSIEAGGGEVLSCCKGGRIASGERRRRNALASTHKMKSIAHHQDVGQCLLNANYSLQDLMGTITTPLMRHRCLVIMLVSAWDFCCLPPTTPMGPLPAPVMWLIRAVPECLGPGMISWSRLQAWISQIPQLQTCSQETRCLCTWGKRSCFLEETLIGICYPAKSRFKC